MRTKDVNVVELLLSLMCFFNDNSSLSPLYTQTRGSLYFTEYYYIAILTSMGSLPARRVAVIA